jgi:parallel beta-helix repeat protein
MKHHRAKPGVGSRIHHMDDRLLYAVCKCARMSRYVLRLAAFGLRYLLLGFLCIPVSATINVKDYGAMGDGSYNDTAALNSGFLAACSASEDVYIPTGTYLVTSLDTLHNCGITFYGDGPSNTILKLMAPARMSMWTFDGSPERTLALVIQNLALDGGHLGGAGIAIERYQAITINRVSFNYFGTPGYSLGHKNDFDGLYIRNVENARVTDSQFTGNERYGVELQAVHSSTVQNSTMSFNGSMGGVSEQNFEGPLDGPLVAQWIDNTLIANGSGGIDVETDPKLPPAQGLLRHNQVIDCGNDRWDAGWGLVLGLHSYGRIEENWIEDFAAHASARTYTNAVVYGRNSGPIDIVNNTVIGTRSHAVLGQQGASPVTISGNILLDNGSGIFIYQSPHVRITNNTISNSAGSGIEVLWSYGSTITRNHFDGNECDLKINGRTINRPSTTSGPLYDLNSAIAQRRARRAAFNRDPSRLSGLLL